MTTTYTPKKIDQTEFGEKGNCMSACLAMMLGMEIAEVPNFTAMNLTDQERYDVMQEWLATIGYQILTFEKWNGNLWPPRGFYIAGGMTSRGFLHAVVMKNGELFHDPHPDREGIKLTENVDLLIPLRPWHTQRELNELRAENERLRNALIEELTKSGIRDLEKHEKYRWLLQP